MTAECKIHTLCVYLFLLILIYIYLFQCRIYLRIEYEDLKLSTIEMTETNILAVVVVGFFLEKEIYYKDKCICYLIEYGFFYTCNEDLSILKTFIKIIFFLI